MEVLRLVVDGTSEGGLHAGAERVLAYVRPHWRPAQLHFKIYTAGATNRLVGVWANDDPEDQVLVRVYGNNTHLFIDRQQEIHTMKMVQEAGCGPRVYASFTNGLCYAFTQGQPLTITDVTREEVWRTVSHAIARFHAIQTGSKKEPMLFPKLRQFLALLPPAFSDPGKQKRVEAADCTKDVLEDLTEELEEHLRALECPVAFCHNDLVMRNIIWHQESAAASFIDFEYAGHNYQPFDIANHFNEYSGMEEVDYSRCPGPTEQRVWLRSYLAHYLGVEEQAVGADRVELWRGWVTKFTLASHLFWGVWAFLQACHSSIDFDYVQYGIIRLMEYKKQKQRIFNLVIEGPAPSVQPLSSPAPSVTTSTTT